VLDRTIGSHRHIVKLLVNKRRVGDPARLQKWSVAGPRTLHEVGCTEKQSVARELWST
jgi:hypothetical protein